MFGRPSPFLNLLKYISIFKSVLHSRLVKTDNKNDTNIVYVYNVHVYICDMIWA